MQQYLKAGSAAALGRELGINERAAHRLVQKADRNLKAFKIAKRREIESLVGPEFREEIEQRQMEADYAEEEKGRLAYEKRLAAKYKTPAQLAAHLALELFRTKAIRTAELELRPVTGIPIERPRSEEEPKAETLVEAQEREEAEKRERALAVLATPRGQQVLALYTFAPLGPLGGPAPNDQRTLKDLMAEYAAERDRMRAQGGRGVMQRLRDLKRLRYTPLEDYATELWAIYVVEHTGGWPHAEPEPGPDESLPKVRADQDGPQSKAKG
jgi:hypothetical protein